MDDGVVVVVKTIIGWVVVVNVAETVHTVVAVFPFSVTTSAVVVVSMFTTAYFTSEIGVLVSNNNLFSGNNVVVVIGGAELDG